MQRRKVEAYSTLVGCCPVTPRLSTRSNPCFALLAPSEPLCRAQLAVKTGTFPFFPLPVMACRLRSLRKVSQTRARPTRLAAGPCGHSQPAPGLFALPLPIARQLEASWHPQRPSRSPSAVPDPLARLPSALPLLPTPLLLPGWPCACR